MSLFCIDIPTHAKKKFILKLEEALDEQPFGNTTIYLLGDVNLDINKFNRSTLAQNYLDGLISKGFFPIITQPSRVTDTFASIINHIITNDLSHKQARSQDLEKGGGYFERVRKVQTTLTRIFIVFESVSHGLSEN